MALQPCPDCGAPVPVSHGPAHAYLGASPGCWKIYGAVLAREYSDKEYFRVHRLTVDAYAVQHPGKPERRSAQSVNIHLLSLLLTMERGLPAEQAAELMEELARRGKTGRRPLPWLPPPADPGRVTVLDVAAARDAIEHRAAVRRWAKCVWEAWSEHHDRVRALAQELLPGA